MAGHILDTPPDSLSTPTERPHVSVVISEQTWNTMRAARPDPQAPAPPGGTGHLTQVLPGCEPVRDLDGLATPPSQLGQLLCDCELSRIVLGADSEVLDHGRDRRLFTPTQRRTIQIRDGGCAWPGCPTPARYTEIHHNTWWHRDHGHTNIDNGIALCRYHHHEIHRHDHTITRAGPIATGPGTTRTDPGQARQPDRPPNPGERRPEGQHPVGRRPVEYIVRRTDGTVVAAPPRPDTS
jgi:hypothetical protein